MPKISPLFAVDAQEMLDAGDIDDAIHLCLKGMEQYPDYPAAMVVLAKAYAYQGDFDSADEVVNNGFERFPNQSVIKKLPYLLEDIKQKFHPEIDEKEEDTEKEDTEEETNIEESIEDFELNDDNISKDDEEIDEIDEIADDKEIEDEQVIEESIKDDIFEEIEKDSYELAETETDSTAISSSEIEEQTEQRDDEPSFDQEIDEDQDFDEDQGIDEDQDLESEEILEDELADVKATQDQSESLNKLITLLDLDYSQQSPPKSLRADNIFIIPGLDFYPFKIHTVSRKPLKIIMNGYLETELFNQKDTFSYGNSNAYYADSNIGADNNHSFGYEIDGLVSKDLPREESPRESTRIEDQLQNLAEKLINTKLSVDSECENKEDLARKHIDGPSVISETIAEIYTNQKAYNEAIEMFEILKSRNPEKTEYYDKKISQIRELSNNED